jgi:hypothetical protein
MEVTWEVVMKVKLAIVLVACTFVFGMCIPAAFAISSPVSRVELTAKSNNIVYGVILDVVCSGEFEKNKCADLTGYVAELKVKRTVKGPRYKRLYIRFMESKFKEGCYGSPDEVHRVGEKGLYYLLCRGDQCKLTSWNGVEYENRAYKTLPSCGE